MWHIDVKAHFIIIMMINWQWFFGMGSQKVYICGFKKKKPNSAYKYLQPTPQNLKKYNISFTKVKFKGMK